MNPTIKLPRRWPGWCMLAFGWLVTILTLQAQSSTGSIQGRVFNPARQEYVRDAEVRLEGTNQVTYTENDGSFRFSNVPAGEATVTVNFTGYNSETQKFAVSAGQTAVREINLTSTAAGTPGAGQPGQPIQLSAFTVSTEREGNAKAIMAQRRNMNISTSVSSDIFGDVTDGNVGEFLKYLPGVDLDYVESEPRGPRLGGMDGQYVGVSFDGMRTASADANRGGGAASRATSFEGFSITAIDSIEINHTASPENDADSPAGTVNMKTKRAFDRPGRRIGYNAGITFNSEEFTLGRTDGPGDRKDYKWGPSYQIDYSESFFNRRFGILVSASQSDSYTEQILVSNGYNTSPTAADPRRMVVRQIDIKDGPKFIHKESFLLTADFKATERLVLSLNMVYSYYDGEFWNRNFTFVAANDNANVNNGRSTVGGDGLTTVIATRAPSGSVNNVATLNNGGGTSAKLTYTRQLAPRFEYKTDRLVIDGAMGFSYSKNNYEAIERGFSNSEGGGVASSWIATRSSPRAAEWVIRQTSGNNWYDLRSFTSTDSRSGGTRISNDDRTWITEKWTGLLNARWAPRFIERFPTAFKFGGKWDEETRDNNNWSDVSVYAYTGPGGNTTTVNPNTGANVNATFGNWGNLGPQYVSANPFETGKSNLLTVYNINGEQGMPPRVSRNAIAELYRANPAQWTYMGTPENYYTSYISNPRDFRQTLSAGYGQADVRISPRLSTRFGVRYEETRNEFKEFDPRSRDEVIAAGYAVNPPGTNAGRPLTVAGMQYQYMSKPKAVRHSNYHNFFPSVVMKYLIQPNFEWQAGFNKSIGRPAVDDLTGLFNIDENAQRVTVANRALQPEFHKKYQTRLAYYFGSRSPGQATLSFSQVNSRNFVQQFDASYEQYSQITGFVNPEFDTFTFRTRLNSLEVQRYRNMDVAYNQTLGFLENPYLRGINVSTNYSRSYANQRRTNVAPHRVSMRLGWNYRKFNIFAAGIWADQKPESATYGRYMGEITKYDVGLTYGLNKWATLYVQGRNITNVRDRWYQADPTGPERDGYLRAMEEYGANWTFGVRGSF